ncbi:unnamed protein product, partial [Musa hybrid cultivar]
PDERGVDRPFPAQQDLLLKDSGDPRKKNSSLGLKWILDEYRLHPNFFEMICSSETEEIILCRIHTRGGQEWRRQPPSQGPICARYPRNTGAMEGGTCHPAIDVPECSW